MWTTVNRSGGRTRRSAPDRCLRALCYGRALSPGQRGQHVEDLEVVAPFVQRVPGRRTAGRLGRAPGHIPAGLAASLPEHRDYEAQLPPQHPGHRRVMITVPEQRPHVYHGLMTMV